MDHNLEFDLMNDKTIIEKCRHSRVYCQNLYSALCNNRFFYGDEEWTCSWRTSGGIVADLRNEGESYVDYYCSGMADKEGYLPESVVSDEIREDLLNLGWTIKSYESKDRLEPGIYRNDWK